jgi:signal transduction histidine kinase/putative methionine-R-sulfoxide reductase with GAF domain
MSTASPAGAYQDHGRTVQGLERELAEAREQQAATAQILAAISSSPTDPHRVFSSIAASAARLCEARDAAILQVNLDHLLVLAVHGPLLHVGPAGQGTLPLKRGILVARAVIDKKTIHVEDLQAETEEYPEGSEFARRLGHRTIVAVPLLRSGEAIGAITVRRTEMRPFTDRQIELLKIFADQAVIAIENERLLSELRESLQQQTATAEVLKVISRSTFDLPAVLQALVDSVARICEADAAQILQPSPTKQYYSAASYGLSSEFIEHVKSLTFEPGRASVTGRVLLEGRAVQVSDVLADPEYNLPEAQRLGGYRTHLGVPLMREGQPIGVIVLSRRSVQPFEQRHIELVATFADQAVIALENTRLFEAEQASKRELQEALRYQTATSEVLNVISRSPTDTQPVFDTIGERVLNLCDAQFSVVSMFDGEHIQLASISGASNEGVESVRSQYPMSVDRETLTARAIRDRTVIHVANVLTDPLYGVRGGWRGGLAVPMLRERRVVGVIFVGRSAPGLFADAQVELLKTFADQAVIAIENARLFDELEEALTRQTATADVLKAISRSAFDLQKVLDTLIEAAARLCGAKQGVLRRREGDSYPLAATYGITPEWRELIAHHRNTPGRSTLMGRVAIEKRTLQIPDVFADPEYPNLATARAAGFRATIGTPLLRGDEQIGFISLHKEVAGPFAAKQVELLESFADQAVIAIENARLFEAEQASKRELQESLGYQTATADVLNVISRSKFDLQPVLDAIVRTANALCSADAIIHLKVKNDLQIKAHHGTIEGVQFRSRVIDRSWVAGRTMVDRLPVHVHDLVSAGDEYPVGREIAIQQGHRTTLGIPLLRENEAIGCLLLRRGIVEPFTEKQISLLQTFADQAVIAIENTRLFEEIAQKSRDLEIASQHKSQFVANMSHELRTPLAAILGYAELMQEGFYEPLGQKSLDALTRIRSNGRHLLGLINTVLDIAKIESGQFTLNMAEYDVQSIVETVRSATESLAQNKKLTLKTDVAKKLPFGLGDEQRLTQVLLNLVGNAIKFTDAGEVRVTASAANSHFTVSVADTGPGIPPDQLTRVFEQFHQVDSSNTKAKGGTGLGLAISKQIVEMHGGRIWVESTLGKGSVFHMELPTRAEFRKVVLPR